ncbi:MAG: hypothetical protein NTV86_10815 [Planctomycetota bacterium]|nr:hypothetical protein [Planctomycetota bacterium]
MMRWMTALALLAAVGPAVVGREAQEAAVPADKKLYVVAVSKATYADPAWRAVVEALVAKHQGRVVPYAGGVESARAQLAAWMPDYICFVARPEEAGRNFVVAVSRMTRQLDDDWSDAVWGILTGYDAADALRIAQRAEPLLVRRGASGLGPGYVSGLESWFAAEETGFWVKPAGQKEAAVPVQPDAAEALANGFNTMKPQVFYTSGHASEHNWNIGYKGPAGQFRHTGGDLCSVDTKGKTFPINSPEPKVYLPMGNCLIGHVDRRDCMATAWMHSGGVYQMYGYTAVTWVGRMGWGTQAAFNGGATLSEAFYFTSQGLLRELNESYPQYAGINFETYDQDKIDWLAGHHGLVKRNEKTGQMEMLETPMGLLWDRDCVGFYGDPAWEARMPVEHPWTQAWSRVGAGEWTLTITPLKDEGGPAGLTTLLPERLTGAKVFASQPGGGPDGKPVVTDNFLIVSPRPKEGYKKAVSVTIRVTGSPMVRPNRQKLAQALAEAAESKPAGK